MEKRQANNLVAALWVLIAVVAACTGVMAMKAEQFLAIAAERNVIAKAAMEKPLNVNSTCKSKFEVKAVPLK